MVSFLPVGGRWINRHTPGALHFVTAVCDDRIPVFKNDSNCSLFFQAVKHLKEEHPFKLIAYVVMPDHCHLIVNPRDGQITGLTGALKSLSARYIIDAAPEKFSIADQKADGSTHQLWQGSFRALALWSAWLIWRKINYIHNNPVKAHLVRSAADYKWSSFRAFYFQADEPLPVDKEWWWPDDVKKLSIAMGERRKESAQQDKEKRKKRVK